MSPHIDFEAKSDRELLMMVAQQSNDICDRLDRVNGHLEDHAYRITILETSDKLRAKIANCANQSPVILTQKQIVGIGAIGFGIGSFLAGLLYGLAKVIGWV